MSQGVDGVKAWSQCLGQELPQLVLSWDSLLIPEPTLSAVWPPPQVGVLMHQTSSVTKPVWERVSPASRNG